MNDRKYHFNVHIKIIYYMALGVGWEFPLYD
jgi:hypothetical protein